MVEDKKRRGLLILPNDLVPYGSSEELKSGMTCQAQKRKLGKIRATSCTANKQNSEDQGVVSPITSLLPLLWVISNEFAEDSCVFPSRY